MDVAWHDLVKIRQTEGHGMFRVTERAYPQSTSNSQNKVSNQSSNAANLGPTGRTTPRRCACTS
eukprot:8443403-Pyramimonas_sp.AAC.1